MLSIRKYGYNLNIKIILRSILINSFGLICTKCVPRLSSRNVVHVVVKGMSADIPLGLWAALFLGRNGTN